MPKTVEEVEAELSELKVSLEAVASKNKELLGELKTERKKNRDGEVDSDKFYALQDKYDELSDLNKKLTHDLKGRDKDLEKLDGSNKALNKNLQSVLIDGGLSDNLSKIGVKSEFLDATKALLRGQVTIVDNQAVVGDKPLSDYMTEWAGAGGKAFIKAPDNSGSGGQGNGNGNGSAKTLSKMSEAERNALYRENPSEFNRLASENK